MKSYVWLFVFLCLGLSCNGLRRDELLPFGEQDNRLTADSDDVSSPEIQLTVPIIFYDTQYKSIFVS